MVVLYSCIDENWRDRVLQKKINTGMSVHKRRIRGLFVFFVSHKIPRYVCNPKIMRFSLTGGRGVIFAKLQSVSFGDGRPTKSRIRSAMREEIRT